MFEPSSCLYGPGCCKVHTNPCITVLAGKEHRTGQGSRTSDSRGSLVRGASAATWASCFLGRLLRARHYGDYGPCKCAAETSRASSGGVRRASKNGRRTVDYNSVHYSSCQENPTPHSTSHDTLYVKQH